MLYKRGFVFGTVCINKFKSRVLAGNHLNYNAKPIIVEMFFSTVDEPNESLPPMLPTHSIKASALFRSLYSTDPVASKSQGCNLSAILQNDIKITI
jgi:hypothetical protein